MPRPALSLLLASVALPLIGCSGTPETDTGEQREEAQPTELRIATFNVSMFRNSAGELATDLADPSHTQARLAASVLQEIRADVVLLNEFDFDTNGTSARLFADNFLAVGQDGREPLDYPHRFVPSVNTGVHSGLDLDNDGKITSTPGSQAYGGDAWGFGEYEGQYGLVVLSRIPISEIRTFQTLPWAEMPNNKLPTDWYSTEEQPLVRLSSKTHADVTIDTEAGPLHFLVSHPTPPTFDGPEDRNGRRNHDEIVFWRDYIDGAGWIYDDEGLTTPLGSTASFVIAGDLNADPNDGDSTDSPIRALLDHERVQDEPAPSSQGAADASDRQGGANANHTGAAANDTADFNDNSVGNLRIDYVLPSANLTILGSGVFWPTADDPNFEIVGDFPHKLSDHRAVWVDLSVPVGR